MKGKNKKIERPNIENIDLVWINEQQKLYSISDYELSLQLGREREYIGGIRTGRALSKIARAAIWQFFKRLEIYPK